MPTLRMLDIVLGVSLTLPLSQSLSLSHCLCNCMRVCVLAIHCLLGASVNGVYSQIINKNHGEHIKVSSFMKFYNLYLRFLC